MKPNENENDSASPSDGQLDPLQTDQQNLEPNNQNISGTSINTPLGLCGMGSSVVGVSSAMNRHTPKGMDDRIEIDETDPDVIPNQYGKWKVKWPF